MIDIVVQIPALLSVVVQRSASGGARLFCSKVRSNKTSDVHGRHSSK
ncbi:unnamed protein product [Amoebophrya sp. A25]|nr:unnamed protein product [Amoebophrya sp. A25]|eukprot:GSA25T00006830001.1